MIRGNKCKLSRNLNEKSLNTTALVKKYRTYRIQTVCETPSKDEIRRTLKHFEPKLQAIQRKLIKRDHHMSQKERREQ